MDGNSFDALAKSWSAGPSRRALLRGIAGGVSAGLLAAVRVHSVAAACTQYGRACGSNDACCSGNCERGKCACASGKTRCGGRCVDLRSNETHCGACDRPCPEGKQCRHGVCTCSPFGAACRDNTSCCSGNCVGGACACRAIHTRCGKRCVDLRWDIENCGACGQACPRSNDIGLTRVCRAGTCVCTPGTADCGGNGICVDLNNDPANCGACGRSCPSSAVCRQGVCAG